MVLTNNRNSFGLISFLEKAENFVSVVSCKLGIEMLKNIKPDIIISYNYKYIIGKEVIEYVNGRIFNLHISLLPWNRGSSPNYWSFIENTPKGVTIHQIDVGLDTGDVFVQEEMFFDEKKESFSTTYNKLNERIVCLFIKNWGNLRTGKYKLIKQKGQGSYHNTKDFERITNGDGIDWDENIADYKMNQRER